MLYIYRIDIYIRRKGLFELFDSRDEVTDKLYKIIPIQTYKYNKDITFVKYTELIYKQYENIKRVDRQRKSNPVIYNGKPRKKGKKM